MVCVIYALRYKCSQNPKCFFQDILLTQVDIMAFIFPKHPYISFSMAGAQVLTCHCQLSLHHNHRLG